MHELAHVAIASLRGIKIAPSYLIPNSQLGTFGSVTQASWPILLGSLRACPAVWARAPVLPPLACMLGGTMQAAQVHALHPDRRHWTLSRECLHVGMNARIT